MKLKKIKLNEGYFYISTIILSIVFSINYSMGSKNEPTAVTSINTSKGIDTLIPRGFVLIPIQINNLSAVAPLLGDYGVVDLYKSSKMIAKSIKILRAPKNPEKFAVMTLEENASKILAVQGPFQIIVQNPSQRKTKFKTYIKNKRRIFKN